MRIARFALLIATAHAGAVELPSMTRDSAFTYLCIGGDGVTISRHNEQHKALESCQRAFLAGDRDVRVVGPTFRFEGEPLVLEPPPAAEPEPEPADEFLLDGDAGTLTLQFTGMEDISQSRSLISKGDGFGVWLWQNQVHATLNGGVYRPDGGAVVPGRQTTVTVTWGPDGFGLAVNGEIRMRDPANTTGMPATGEVLVGSSPTPGQVDATTPVCASVQAVETQMQACPATTLDTEAVPCAL